MELANQTEMKKFFDELAKTWDSRQKEISPRDELIKFQNERGERKYGFKYGFLTRRDYAKYKTNNIDSNFKTNFYKVKAERTNFISVFLVMFFIFILVMAIIRK